MDLKKIAIVGLAPSSHDEAPLTDSSWEKFGLPWDTAWVHMDRFFEMHDLRLIESDHCALPKGYIDKIKEIAKYAPLYMQEEYFEGAEKFPFYCTDRQYYNSSIAYAMALAISEKPDVIGLWGVDMADHNEEFFYQRPNMEYLIGLAEGRGIDVYIPEQSPLCKFSPKGINYYNHYPEYKGRYGKI